MTFERLAILREADAIYLEETRLAGLYDAIWEAFAVLLPARTVGMMGDGRTYDLVCGLRAVTSTDGMTADVYPFTMEQHRVQCALALHRRARTPWLSNRRLRLAHRRPRQQPGLRRLHRQPRQISPR